MYRWVAMPGIPKIVGLMTCFAVRMTAECQAGRGDEFSARRSCAKKLPHR